MSCIQPKNLRLEYLFDGACARVSFHRPEALNALNRETLFELDGLVTEFSKQKKLMAVVLAGSEKAFVAGADIKEISALNPAQAGEFADLGQKVFARLEGLNCAVIAEVAGFALGGGFELALACDWIIAASSARFALPEVSLGLIPGFGGTQRLSRVAGLACARDLILTGRRITADEALQYGIVSRVVPPESLQATVRETVQMIVSRGPKAIGAAKAAINGGFDLDLARALALERAQFSELFASGEPQEGCRAFMEKRPAQFTRG